MRRSKRRLRWACSTAAPWALAAGLLISFTASAGHNPDVGYSVSPLKIGAPTADDVIITGKLFGRVEVKLASLDTASLDSGLLSSRPGNPAQDGIGAVGVDVFPGPREDLKSGAAAFPDIDRSRRGDPILALRPSVSRESGEDIRNRLASLFFNGDERTLTASVFSPGSVSEPLDDEALTAFEPWDPSKAGTTEEAQSDTPPQAMASTPTASLPEGTGAANGTSPATPRALALASTTPVPADSVPTTIAGAPVSLPVGPDGGVSAIGKGLQSQRSRYADMLDTDKRQMRCLAEAVYFEARSESEAGQAAVAQVVLNRAMSGLYPDNICGVVFQNRHRYLGCQFTFACEGKSLRITDPESWATATRIAREVVSGETYLAEVGGSTHYHADYVRPRWAKRLKKMDVIGRHIFYQLRPGQT